MSVYRYFRAICWVKFNRVALVRIAGIEQNSMRLQNGVVINISAACEESLPIDIEMTSGKKRFSGSPDYVHRALFKDGIFTGIIISSYQQNYQARSIYFEGIKSCSGSGDYWRFIHEVLSSDIFDRSLSISIC